MDFVESSNQAKKIDIESSILLKFQDIVDMLCNEFLHDIRSFFIIKDEAEYDDSRLFQYGTVVDRIKVIEDSYSKGKTVIIKDIEFWNKDIINMCKKLSYSTNAHLYLSPKDGTGFGWHQDDRDVYIMMQIGKKKFEIQSKDGQVQEYMLSAGDSLYIPYGHRHRAAVGSDQGSVHIGFGVWPKDITIKDSYEKFPVPVSISL